MSEHPAGLERFDLEPVKRGYYEVDQMVAREDGDWVRYEDVAALIAERGALRETLAVIAYATIHPDDAAIMPAAMSHMKVSDFARWAQWAARGALNPEVPA